MSLLWRENWLIIIRKRSKMTDSNARGTMSRRDPFLPPNCMLGWAHVRNTYGGELNLSQLIFGPSYLDLEINREGWVEEGKSYRLSLLPVAFSLLLSCSKSHGSQLDRRDGQGARPGLRKVEGRYPIPCAFPGSASGFILGCFPSVPSTHRVWG